MWMNVLQGQTIVTAMLHAPILWVLSRANAIQDMLETGLHARVSFIDETQKKKNIT